MTETVERELRGKRALWRIETPLPLELRSDLQITSPMLAHLLYCRGYRTLEQIDGFFTAGTVSHDPFALPDMERAVERIERAVQSGEQVAVYGDFDCDGITAAAILAETLAALGLHPWVHIPTRADGHGLQPEGLAALADAGVTLVISADCGIGALEEVRVARGMGMDVIITDHHEPRADGALPYCPVISPTRQDSLYLWRSLCGAGVAFKLAQALADRIPGAPDPDRLLDLAALGTVADVVPLRDENRSLVIRGLRKLRETDRPGLLALFHAAGVEQSRIDPVSVGFYLAPRINAANRMASPRMAYDLITATDAGAAADLAAQLSKHNEARQELVADRFETIVCEVGATVAIRDDVRSGRIAPLLLVRGDWPSGISGLLATRLVERYGLPAFVAADSSDGTISVSARGVPGMHVDELLERCEDAIPGGIFLGHGGHSRAGGFRVSAERFDLAKEILEREAFRTLHLDHIGAELRVDAEVGLTQMTLDAAHKVRSLAPFGMEFEEPLFLCRGLSLQRVTPISGGKHARLSVQQGMARMDAVHFQCDPALFTLPLGSHIDAVFHLQLDEWNGTTRVQLSVRDWRPS